MTTCSGPCTLKKRRERKAMGQPWVLGITMSVCVRLRADLWNSSRLMDSIAQRDKERERERKKGKEWRIKTHTDGIKPLKFCDIQLQVCVCEEMTGDIYEPSLMVIFQILGVLFLKALYQNHYLDENCEGPGDASWHVLLNCCQFGEGCSEWHYGSGV